MAARILVIEDNSTNLDLMTYLLNAFGYTTLTATDGEAGLHIAQRETLDLIICDLQLPRLNGYEVACWLKSHPTLRTIPIVAVTALAMVGDREQALAVGFDGYMSKPIDPQVFVGQIEHFFKTEQSGTLLTDVSLSSWVAPLQHKRATLLVVDDRPLNIDLAHSIFEPFGYTVIPAYGMEEALTLAHHTAPDLILSDINMTHGTGFDFITAVKADSWLRAIPFLFITSTFLDPKDRIRGLELGAAGFIMRPIEPQALLTTVESCLHERSKDHYGDDSDC